MDLYFNFPPFPAQTVLIIEDNRLNALIAKKLVESIGHSAIEADTGQEGISLFRTKDPALVLLDMQLGDMTGLEVFACIQQEALSRRTPIAAMTGHAYLEDQCKTMHTGFTDYFTKPLIVEKFLNQMHVYLFTVYSYRTNTINKK